MTRYILSLMAFFFLALGGTIYASSHPLIDVDDQTKEQCRIYAERDHEKEFTPERWAWGKDWIQSYDFYDSCINHVKYALK